MKFLFMRQSRYYDATPIVIAPKFDGDRIVLSMLYIMRIIKRINNKEVSENVSILHIFYGYFSVRSMDAHYRNERE